jgi:hypothetical protein
VVAEDWLREGVAAGCSRQQALAVGLLVAAQRQQAADGRHAWKLAWELADRKKVRAWLE